MIPPSRQASAGRLWRLVEELEEIDNVLRPAVRDILPTIVASAALFPTAEITGDVVVGERTIIGAGAIVGPGAIMGDELPVPASGGAVQ